MDDIETVLRPDPSEMTGLAPQASVDRVVARGRRRLMARRAGGGLTLAVLVGGLWISARGSEPPQLIDSVDDSVRQEQSADDNENRPPAQDPPPPSQATEVTSGPTTSAISTTTSTPSETRSEERIELRIRVTTDASRYASGAPVAVTIEACNEADRDAVEYFAAEDTMFRVRMVTEDDRTVALGFHGREGDAVQTWAPGECRRYGMVWDQREGEFGSGDGQQAWPGDYTAQVDWFSTDPPPPGMDPGLYDPAMPSRRPSVSPVFAIEEPDGQPPTSLTDQL